MRYVEIDGQLRKVLVVVKTRAGNHSKDIREYMITDQGVVIIGPLLSGFRKITTGLPEPVPPSQTGPAPEVPG